MEPVLQKRELKASGYRWEHRGKKLYLIYTKTDEPTIIPLTKVAAMSLVKFIPNYLDKMRIEEGKALRARLRNVRSKEIERRKKLKKKIRNVRERLVEAKARKVK